MAERRWRSIGTALLIGGILFRCVTIVVGRSLNIDEAMLALNVAPRDWSELLAPQRFDQIVPPLFLFTEKLSVTLFGMTPTSLRLVPILASILLLVLLREVGARLFGQRAGALAIVLAVASPLLFRYSDEIKQYGLEALAATALVLLALRVQGSPDRRESWLALLVAGIVATVAGIGSVFAQAGVVAGLALTPEAGLRSSCRRRLVGVAAVWLAAMLLLYVGYYGPRTASPYLDRYWAMSYPRPGIVQTVYDLTIYAMEFFSQLLFVERQGTRTMNVLSGLLVAIGTAVLLRGRRIPELVMLLTPMLFAVAGTMVHRYPPSARLWLFAAPAVILLTVLAIETLASLFPPGRRSTASLGLALALAAFPFSRTTLLHFRGDSRETVPKPETVEVWRASRAAGDATYIGNRGIPAWIYYTADWNRQEDPRLAWFLRAAEALGPNAGNVPSRGRSVGREGDSLVWQGPDGAELLGIPTGAEVRMGIAERGAPDHGWADNEARRLLAATRECIWVVYIGGEWEDRYLLVRSLMSGGAALAGRWESRRAVMIGLQGPAATRPCHPRIKK